MVSPPPGLPVLGLEGVPPGCRTIFPWPGLAFPAEPSGSSSPGSPRWKAIITARQPFIFQACARAGESLSNDSLYSESGCEALKTQHSQ